MPTSDSHDYDLIDRLAEEFAKRFRNGERPSVQEYCDKYPHIAEDLRDMLPALAEVEQVKDEVQPPAAVEPPKLRQIGDYQILREVGRGGMGVVYEADDTRLGRRVALKVLATGKAGHALERFKREARAAARLHHTNIVPVFGVGDHDGLPYYVMQFIQGLGLDEVLDEVKRLQSKSGSTVLPSAVRSRPRKDISAAAVARSLVTGTFEPPAAAVAETLTHVGQASSLSGQVGSLSHENPVSGSAISLPGQSTLSGRRLTYWQSVAQIGLQVADALDYAHKQGILHRDIKPSNLLHDLHGVVWVTDFGLAKAADQEDLTHTGDVLGTLRYMPPEAFEGKSDARSDVYALGLTMYELLALRPAFDERKKEQLVRQVTTTDPPRLGSLNRTIPRDLQTIVHKAIEKDPDHRYKSAADLGADLRRFLADQTILARQVSPAERFARWCRRNPTVASLSAAIVVLLATLSVGTLLKNAALATALGDSEAARHEAERANERASAELWNAYLLRARAGRTSGRAGQRFDGLRTLQKAMSLPVPEGRSRLEFRNEAIACLSLPDVEWAHELDCPPDERRALAFDPSFTRYARSDARGRVSVRRVDHDQELFALPPAAGEASGTGSLGFSPDGRLLCQVLGTYPDFSALRMWLVEGGAARLVLQVGHPISDYSFNGDGRRLAVLRADATVVVFDTSDGRELRPIQSPGRGTTMIRFHPRLPRLAMFGPGRVSIVDVTSGLPTSEFATDQGPTRWAAWHPNGEILALTFDDRRIHFFDPETGQAIGEPLEEDTSGGVLFQFNHRGDVLASTDWSGLLRLWDVPTRRLVLETKPPMIYYLLQFSADDRFLAAGFRGDRLGLLHVASGAELGRIARPPSPNRTANAYKSAVVDPTGDLLGLWLGDGMAVADLGRREEVAFFPGAGLHSLIPLGFDPGGGLRSAGDGGLLRWPRTQSEGGPGGWRFGPPVRLTTHQSLLDPPAVSADGQSILVPARGRGAYLYRSGQAPVTLGPQREVRMCALSPNGRWAATPDHEHGVIRVWDTEHPSTSRELLPRGGYVQFSPDGRWLLTYTEDGGGEARLWHVGSWEPGPRFAARWGTAFSADGRMLALSTGDGSVRLVVPDSGTELATLNVPDRTQLVPQCFTPDGRRLIACGTESGATYVWDLALIRSELRELGLDWSDEPIDATVVPVPGRRPVTLDPGLLRDRERWTAVLAFYPFHADGYYRRALAYLDHRQTREALADLDQAIRLDQGHGDALYRRSLLRQGLGNAGGARADLDRVLEVRPGHTEARARRGWLHADAGRWPEAVADLSRVCREAPADDARWQWLAMAALGANDRTTYLNARTWIQHVLSGAVSPDRANWLTWTIGLGAQPSDDLGRALTVAERDFRDHPKSYPAARSVSLVRLRSADLNGAMRALEAATALQAASPTCWLMMSQIHARQGRPERAREQYRRYEEWKIARLKADGRPDGWSSIPWYERQALACLADEAEAALRGSVPDRKE